MSTKPGTRNKNKRDPDLAGAEAAFQRAVRRVRERAAQTGRPIAVIRDGRIVEEIPKNCAAGLRAFTPEANEASTYRVAELFPEYLGQELQPALRAYRTREGLTQKQLAAMTGIPQHHISEMETGKRGIGKERAKKLAEALHCDYRQLL